MSNRATENTYLDKASPTLIVDAFEFFLKEGDKLKVRYLVCDAKMSNLSSKGDATYTTHLSADGTELEQTTLAGFHEFVIPAKPKGQHKFFIQTTDSDGRQSNYVQFEYIVQSTDEPETYTMKESDLETYGIEPNNSTDAAAKANVTGLTNLFAWCAEQGYDKIVMLTGEYWVWSNTHPGHASMRTTDVVRFPSNFTVDFNGSTICTPFVSYESRYADQILLYKNTNTHLCNGTLKGMYPDFNFNDLYAGTGEVKGEKYSVLKMRGCRFCSVRNMKITGSIGYDCVLGNASRYKSSTDFYEADNLSKPSFDKEGYIDTDGVEHEGTYSNLKFTSGYKTIPYTRNGKEFFVGEYLGNGGYNGERTIFVHFYDANKNHLCTMKTEQRLYVTPPANAAYYRITGYGSLDELNSNTTLAYYDCVGIKFDGCTFENDRTIAFGPQYFRQHLVKGCIFKNVSRQHGGDKFYEVTPYIADYEDGWQHMQMIWWVDNECVTGKNGIVLTAGYNSVFRGNTNIYLRWYNGSVENTLVEQNSLRTGCLVRRTSSNVKYHRTAWVSNQFLSSISIYNKDAVDDGRYCLDEYFYNCYGTMSVSSVGPGYVYKITDNNL